MVIMRKIYQLKPFQPSLNHIEIEVDIQDDIVTLNYMANLSERIELWENNLSHKKRKIGLWENTCFEFFLKNKKTGEYLEFNFSGTGLYNVFYFLKRDQELTEYLPFKFNKHRFIKKPKVRLFEFSFNLNQCPKNLRRLNDLSFSPTVILNNEDNEKEYFCIEHKLDKPDFHNDEVYLNFTDFLDNY